eukprot:1702477-Rhodomonas_salina.2
MSKGSVKLFAQTTLGPIEITVKSASKKVQIMLDIQAWNDFCGSSTDAPVAWIGDVSSDEVENASNALLEEICTAEVLRKASFCGFIQALLLVASEALKPETCDISEA